LHSIYNIKNDHTLALKSNWVADVAASSFCMQPRYDHSAKHYSFLISWRPTTSAMHGSSLIPHYKIADPPFMVILEFWSRRFLVQHIE